MIPIKPNSNFLEIWLVDDAVECSLLLMKLLNYEPGIKCTRHFTATTAMLLALERETPPHAILIDVNGSVMSGIDVIPQIKKITPYPVIITLSTYYDSFTKWQSLAAGASGYLLKRCSSVEIIAAIQAAQSPVMSSI
jgi:DNA-binding NarL/FixJ family response regulator